MSRSLSIDEAAARLGTSISNVRRAMRMGEFPGRFLEGSVLRIPEVNVAEAKPTWLAQETVVEVDLQSGLSSSGHQEGLSKNDLEDISRAIARLLQHERQEWIDAVLAPLDKQDGRLMQLEEEVRALRGEIRALGSGAPADAGNLDWSADSEGPEPVDFRGLSREIADLEALLGDFDLD